MKGVSFFYNPGTNVPSCQKNHWYLDEEGYFEFQYDLTGFTLGHNYEYFCLRRSPDHGTVKVVVVVVVVVVVGTIFNFNFFKIETFLLKKICR